MVKFKNIPTPKVHSPFQKLLKIDGKAKRSIHVSITHQRSIFSWRKCCALTLGVWLPIVLWWHVMCEYRIIYYDISIYYPICTLPWAKKSWVLLGPRWLHTFFETMWMLTTLSSVAWTQLYYDISYSFPISFNICTVCGTAVWGAEGGAGPPRNSGSINLLHFV